MEEWPGGGQEAALEGELVRVGEDAGCNGVDIERSEGTKELELGEGKGATDDGCWGVGRASKGSGPDGKGDRSSEAPRAGGGK